MNGKIILICLLQSHTKKTITRIIEEGVFIVNHEGEILNSKTEWHQRKIICTTILQGGAEMARGMMTGFPVAGRRGDHTAVAQHVETSSTNQEPPLVTGGTTRAMARANLH